MSKSYDVETQAEDLAAIAAAEGILSALVAGERKVDLKPQMDVYARIAGYHKGPEVRRVARMFWTLCTHKDISGFECRDFATLLPQVRRLVKTKLIRRRKAERTCLLPDVHQQKCWCASLARAQGTKV